MRTASQTENRKHSKSSLCKSHQQVLDLKKLMSGIKDLQNKVSQMPIYLQITKSNRLASHTPKMKQKCCSSKSKYVQSIPSKREQRENSVKTIRKSDFCPKYDSVMLSNDSKTFHLNFNKRQALTGPSKDLSCFESIRESDLMNNYVSLQLQNLKLQKYNLELQKQLVEQSLLMERREKQLLKSKLKRMKTHQNNDLSHKSTSTNNQQVQTPVVSSFNVSPIKIKIPELINLNDEPITKKTNNKKQPETNPVFLEDAKNDTSMDSLLLSDEHQSSSRVNTNKCSENTLEKQFWQLVKEPQKLGRGEARQALGDIANKLKVARNK